jgi:molybdate transport system permease protein
MIDGQALALSLKLGAASTAILCAFGLPFTYWLSRKSGAAVVFLEAFFSLPLVLPPTVLGFYLLLALGPLGLAFSFGGLLVASVLSGMPLALQSFLAAFRGVDRKYLENAWLLGEGEAGAFFRVAVPLAKEGLLTGAILAFAHALGEFGVVLMIGGNIPGVSRTFSLTLYDQVVSFDYAAANRTAGLLLACSLLSLGAVAWLKRRGGRP